MHQTPGVKVNLLDDGVADTFALVELGQMPSALKNDTKG
jgi:hypothetical protein